MSPVQDSLPQATNPPRKAIILVAPPNRDADVIYSRLVMNEKAMAHKILDVLDEAYPTSPDRDKVRKAILDNLAWGREEMNKWLNSAQDSAGTNGHSTNF